MAKIGKISSIDKKYPVGQKSIEATLSNNYGKNKFPGTSVRKFPYRLANGEYITGLEDKPELKAELEKATRLNLNPDSDYYNHTSNGKVKVEPVRLEDGDNIFNLDEPYQAITYHWLAAHPTIASSWDAWEAGKYPSNTEFYVNNVEIETERQYKKDLDESQAIQRLTVMSPDKTRKVARLLGYPVTDETKYEYVYTQIYGFLKEGLAKIGPYKGMNCISKFNQFAAMKDEDLHVSDLVEQGIRFNIFRISAGGRLMKGEAEIAKSKEEYIDYLKSRKGQEQLVNLEKDLNVKESVPS